MTVNYLKILLLSLLLASDSVLAFQINMEKDTTYSINSAYLKYKKNYPEIKIVVPKYFDHVIEKKDITYRILDNRNLYLDAYINSTKNNPAVILIHGGGWKSGDKSMMQPMAQYIASKGYSCFAIEYRLSDEAAYPEGIYDIKKAIQFIKENSKAYHVDSSKVAVLGCSSGAQMASLVSVTNNNPKFEENLNSHVSSSVHAIVNLDGILAFKHPESQEGAMASLWLGGTYEEIPKIWEEASPLTHTNMNTPPILFINSQFERFHAGRDDMIAVLNEHHIYSQVETLPNSPHSFWLFHPWFESTLEYIIPFLDKTLKRK